MLDAKSAIYAKFSKHYHDFEEEDDEKCHHCCLRMAACASVIVCERNLRTGGSILCLNIGFNEEQWVRNFRKSKPTFLICWYASTFVHKHSRFLYGVLSGNPSLCRCASALVIKPRRSGLNALTSDSFPIYFHIWMRPETDLEIAECMRFFFLFTWSQTHPICHSVTFTWAKNYKLVTGGLDAERAAEQDGNSSLK